jgi:tetratricopeptide (TPR) repeat protein
LIDAEFCFRQAYDQGVKDNNVNEQCLGLHDIGTVNMEVGKYKEAEGCCLRILQIARSEKLGDQLTLSKVKVNLADLYSKDGQYDKAESLFKTILQESPKTRDGELTAINALGARGTMMQARGAYDQALACYTSAIQRCNNLNPVPESALEQNLNNLAPLYVSMNKPQLAYEASSKALTLARKLFGETANSTIVAYNNVGSALLLMEHYAAAEEILKQSLAAIEKSPDVKLTTRIGCINGLGCVCLKSHRWKEAMDYLKSACEMCSKAGPSQSVMLTQSLINLGTAYNRAGDEQAADETFRKAIAAAAQSGSAVSQARAKKYYDAYLEEHHRPRQPG